MLSKFNKLTKQREDIVNKIINDMNCGEALPWDKPWKCSFAPMNPISGTTYHGINRFNLAISAILSGFNDNRWCTFNQIKDNGWHLVKGSSSTSIENWKFIPNKNQQNKNDEENDGFFTCVGYWNVFNFAQIEGTPQLNDHECKGDFSIANNLIVSSRCKVIETSSDISGYNPSQDNIVLPFRYTFKSVESFTSTLAHEMAHSTCKVLNRCVTTNHNSKQYTAEELIAELAAVFVCADLNIHFDNSEFKNHSAYINSWSNGDTAAFYKSVSYAEKAANYIVKNALNAQCIKSTLQVA